MSSTTDGGVRLRRDVVHDLDRVIQRCFSKEGAEGANPSWPNDWMLVLSLLHRYSSSGITPAIIRAEAQTMAMQTVASTQWAPLQDLNASHGLRCRVRFDGVHCSAPLIVDVASVDGDHHRQAFVHNRFQTAARNWTATRTVLRIGDARLAGKRILPTPLIVEEIAMSSVALEDNALIGCVTKRRDGRSEGRNGTCLVLTTSSSQATYWFAWGEHADVMRLVQVGDWCLVKGVVLDPRRSSYGEMGLAGASVVESTDATIVQIIMDPDADLISSLPRHELKEPGIALTQAMSTSQHPVDLYMDGVDLDGQRLTLAEICHRARETDAPLVHVSFVASITSIDRQLRQASVEDGSGVVVNVVLNEYQCQAWQPGQTLFACRLRSTLSPRLFECANDPLVNVSLETGLLASTSLYTLTTLHERPRRAASMFVALATLAEIHEPMECTPAMCLADDGTDAVEMELSCLAFTTVLSCSLQAFVRADRTTRSQLIHAARQKPVLALVTTIDAGRRLRIEHTRPPTMHQLIKSFYDGPERLA
ncbi:CST complex subunit CTC1 [Plasmodiophora brassicae]|uniref:Uncharacterized protein n=2 Tax=Plasmodiophora brassicae TaxID=37360 RepID=A0A3P3XYL4_PLABS|nr:unnamed protein product [Plasmodiophora brassicae]